MMVWADCDDDFTDGEALKAEFWNEANRSGIARDDFDHIVFIFAKDRLENWIEFLTTGQTREDVEGPRLEGSKAAAEAAKKLADICRAGRPVRNMPPSLLWSCENWRVLVKRMQPR